MKKFILVLGLLVSCSVFADAKDVLKQRLDKVQGFYAQFSQQVKTADKQVIQEGKGQLWVNRPNYFNWTITEPDETMIISDNKDIWIYTPAVEQVTVMSLNQAVDNQLLLLITDSHNKVWNDYRVDKNDNTFTLKPTNNTNGYFIISVLPTGMIADFTIVETDGQRSYYELSHQSLGIIDMKHFKFTIPQGVTVDDQR
ncbi:outer membrane lipoprotein carrier protein [Orbus hercynius]|uniref:Outer-membrane lipoprotein carrier protein n=1 Tax=Orbus hercynius TaxID=593135 RepID=A0A495RCB5_9GAMM|nr:outer membrane lipoprotein chaperone LolA [Orbus hercynius]RKS85112.1 outer membrane lipoprotein carrier protein [Orbus hercynius]